MVQKTVLKRFANRVRNTFVDAKVYLFGSRARGDNLVDSDIDLLVISLDFAKIPFVRRAGKVAQLYDGDEYMDILCYTPEEFTLKKKELGVVSQADKEKVLL
jgi:predicted nucleotidyltransferase